LIGINEPKSLNGTIDKFVSALAAALVAIGTHRIEIELLRKYTEDKTGVYHARNDINSKLKELYQYPGTAVHNANTQYTATMVAGTVWAVIASGLIYYVFTEL
jgi:hypothetical protein